MEHINIDICTDCALFIANGDVPDDNGWDPGDIERTWPDSEGWQISIGYMHADDEGHEDTGADDTEFTWRPCEGCGSRLGGSRLAACASRRVTTV